MARYRSFLVLIIVCGLVSAQEDVHEGSECLLLNGGIGVCVVLHKCSPALENLLSNIHPVTCSYSGFTPIVCCSQPPAEITNSPVTKVQITVTPPPTSSGSFGSISERKCVQYGKAVYQLESTFIPGETANVSVCGVDEGSPFILGGTRVNPKEFPHMAAIGYDTNAGRSWLCGGTLISERFVLTAAHCLDDHKQEGVSDPKYVRLGDVNLNEDNESEGQHLRVKTFYQYPDYHAPIKYHDIGLIQLDKDALFDAYVRPACLQTSRDHYPENTIIIGWGKVEYWQFQQKGKGAWSQDLLKAVIQSSTFDYCKAKYDGLPAYSTSKVLADGVIDDWMLCFGDKKGERDACKGDSGGPLQYLRKDPECMYNVLGITSFGNRCGKPDFPSIYTRISYYVPWIENIVWPNETADSL